jgi:hypothetical protein
MTCYRHFDETVYDVVSIGLVKLLAKNDARCRE